MIDINIIKDNSIIICPNSIKSSLLKELAKNNSTAYIKFLEKNELFRGLYFDYDYDALYYLHKKYNFNYSNAQEILDVLRGPLKECSDKTRQLLEIYKDLKSNSLLKFNPLFKELFKDKTIYIFGYSSKDLELLKALDNLDLKYEFLKDNKKNYQHTVYEFKNIDEEVLYLFNSIASLIEKGVSLNDIFLYKYPSEYQLILDKYRNLSKIPLEIDEDKKLQDSPLYTRYKTLLKEHQPISAFNELNEQISVDSYGFLTKLSSLIISLSSLNLDNNEFSEILDYLASKKTLSTIKYDKAIKIIDSSSEINDNQYVFMLGFDVNNYPKIKKDIDYLLDVEKEALGRTSSNIENQIERENLSCFISNIKNLTITFKEKNNKNIYFPSLLIKELGLNKEEGRVGDKRYFDSLLRLEIAKYKDNYYKYGEYNHYMNMYDDKSLDYKCFEHAFKPIPINNIDRFLSLSYTTINEFNECPFRYFSSNVLKAKTYESNYSLALGNLFHKILEDSISKEIDFNNYKEDIANDFVSNKDKFFLNMHLEQLKEVLEKNKKFAKNSFFKKVLPEKKIRFNLDKNTVLEGKIDKTMIDEGTQKIAVVDYKTGSFKFEIDKVKYGLSLQLPIYKLLLENVYPNYEIVGLFIQRILVNLSKEKECKEKYYLDGLYSSDMNTLKLLDKSWLNTFDDNEKLILKSSYISGLTSLVSLSELSKASLKKVIPENLSQICKEKVLETVTRIRNNDFNIEPVMVEDKPRTLACNQCSYKDICFMKRSDIKIIPKGGEEE